MQSYCPGVGPPPHFLNLKRKIKRILPPFLTHIAVNKYSMFAFAMHSQLTHSPVKNRQLCFCSLVPLVCGGIIFIFLYHLLLLHNILRCVSSHKRRHQKRKSYGKAQAANERTHVCAVLYAWALSLCVMDCLCMNDARLHCSCFTSTLSGMGWNYCVNIFDKLMQVVCRNV